MGLDGDLSSWSLRSRQHCEGKGSLQTCAWLGAFPSFSLEVLRCLGWENSVHMPTAAGGRV